MGEKWLFFIWLFGLIILFEPLALYAWQLPDTGQTECYDDQGRTINCPKPGQQFAGQDGSYTINPPSYTKLDANGSALPVSAASWAMIRDNVTGLIWEKKTNKDSATNYINPHDADNTYDWYDSNSATNGGHAGYWNSGRNTEVFIADLNTANFGGFNDWRMPTRRELRSISMYGPRSPGPAINTDYFSNTKWDYYDRYWSSNSDASYPASAWYIHFDDGDDFNASKSNSFCARAVRGGN